MRGSENRRRRIESIKNFNQKVKPSYLLNDIRQVRREIACAFQFDPELQNEDKVDQNSIKQSSHQNQISRFKIGNQSINASTCLQQFLDLLPPRLVRVQVLDVGDGLPRRGAVPPLLVAAEPEHSAPNRGTGKITE
jgi:translation initiation factor 2B subunit (eIF-2B alpha/beta/delta family)